MSDKSITGTVHSYGYLTSMNTGYTHLNLHKKSIGTTLFPPNSTKHLPINGDALMLSPKRAATDLTVPTAPVTGYVNLS